MILTNNPGFIAAALYDGDPNNQEVPDSFHNEYHNGVVSYTLALAAGLPPLFSQDVNGLTLGPTAAQIAGDYILRADNTWLDQGDLNAFAEDVYGVVPGPDAADIAANRLLQADGTWVDPDGAGVPTYLNQNGAGSFVQSTSGSAGGNAVTGTKIDAGGDGTIALGNITNTNVGSFIDAQGSGGIAFGQLEGTAVSTITQLGDGSLIFGRVNNGSMNVGSAGFGFGDILGNSYLISQGTGGAAFGQCSGTGGIQNDPGGIGALLFGDVDGAGSNIFNNSPGCLLFGQALSGGTITTNNPGNMAFGYVADAGTIESVGANAGLAFGNCQIGGRKIRVANGGALAFGTNFSTLYDIDSQGFGSMAGGYLQDSDGQDIRCNGDGSFQWGSGNNGTSRTFQIGNNTFNCDFNAGADVGLSFLNNSLRMLPAVHPTAPADGDIWKTGANVFIRSGGSDVQIQAAAGGGLNQDGAGFTEGTGGNAGGQTTSTGTIVASGIASLAIGASDDSGLRNILANARGSVAMGDAVGSTAITAEAIGAMQFGGGSNTTAHSAQFGGTLRVNWGTPGFSLFGAPVNGQQVHVADPTDLATCITAITAINLMCANYGLTAAA